MIVCGFAPGSASSVPNVWRNRCIVMVGLPPASTRPAVLQTRFSGAWGQDGEGQGKGDKTRPAPAPPCHPVRERWLGWVEPAVPAAKCWAERCRLRRGLSSWAYLAEARAAIRYPAGGQPVQRCARGVVLQRLVRLPRPRWSADGHRDACSGLARVLQEHGHDSVPLARRHGHAGSLGGVQSAHRRAEPGSTSCPMSGKAPTCTAPRSPPWTTWSGR